MSVEKSGFLHVWVIFQWPVKQFPLFQNSNWKLNEQIYCWEKYLLDHWYTIINGVLIFSLVKYKIGASIPNWVFVKSKLIWTSSDTCVLDNWACLSLVRDSLSSDLTKCVLCTCEERCLQIGFRVILGSGFNRAAKMFKGPDANSSQLHTDRQDFPALLLQAESINPSNIS